VGVHYALLWTYESHLRSDTAGWFHAGGTWLVAALLTWESAWWIGRHMPEVDTWTWVAWGIVPLTLMALVLGPARRLRWPFAAHWPQYHRLGLGPLAAYLVVFSVVVQLHSNGDPAPLPYLPVLNPLDLTLLLALLTLGFWHSEYAREPTITRATLTSTRATLGALAFIGLTAAVVRTVHHWGGVEFRAAALLDSVRVHASISVLWSVIALITMVVATRRGWRSIWIVGATLSGIVVVKLFTIDLSGTGTIERIVSFMMVGVLLLLVGYFSPVPPKSSSDRSL
jgi:uncharacterized membrane protein